MVAELKNLALENYAEFLGRHFPARLMTTMDDEFRRTGCLMASEMLRAAAKDLETRASRQRTR